MAIAYQNITEQDLSLGIDARSAENQIGQGFVLDLLNADVVEKRVRKRVGSQSYAGNVPVRVTRLDYEAATGMACFTLDSSVSLDTAVSLDTVRSSPLVVYGRSSNQTVGPWTTSGDTVKYYSQFTVPTRKLLQAPSGTLSIPASEHGFATTNLFVDVVEATSIANRSYSTVQVNSITASESTFDLNIAYNTYQDRNVYVFYADKTPSSGNSYVATLTHTGSGSETFSIPTATHNLTNFSITTQIQQDLGTSRVQVVPETFLVATNGDISVTLNSSTATTFYVILSAAPVTNQVSGVIGAGATGSVSITNLTKPWIFLGIYLEQTPGGTKELVYPDTIDYDDTSKSLSVSFTNLSSLARNFIIFYEYGDVRSNVLCITDPDVTVDGTDMEPQITLWGLDHSEIYSSKEAREGWVNHIDSYRRSGEQRLICGLGGNLFEAAEYSEAASQYLLPTLYPRLFARSANNQIIGPLFYNTGDTPKRTRGYITSDNSGTNWAQVTSVQYDSGNTWTKYIISLPNKLIVDSTGNPTSLAGVISTTLNLEDWLTVENMSYSRHNGTFRIRQVQDGTNVISIWVENSNNSDDYDDLNTGGQAGVFTDQMNWLTPSPFIPQDSLVTPALGDTFQATVISSLNTRTVSGPFSELFEVPGGLLINGARVSSIIPLRNGLPSLTESVENLVKGDVLSYTGIKRLLRVQYINADSDRTVNITSDGSEATATLSSGDTSYLNDGQKILLLNAGKYTGLQTISNVLSGSVFIFLTEETDSVSGATLAGDTIQVDEELSWQDSPGDQTVFQIARRWIPIEAPDDNFNLTPNTHTRYFKADPYGNQSFIRSTMVTDNSYLTNDRDEVLKFEGSSLYRAGLPTWQPGLFVTQSNTATAKIVTSLRQIAYTAADLVSGKLTIASTDQNVIPVGNTVRLSGSNIHYTVQSYENDGSAYFLIVDRSLDASVTIGPGTVSETGTYKYYFRLNAVDANDNIVTSIISSSQDFAVEMTEDAQIQLKLVGLPVLGNYDYDRLEVQIYRTTLLTALASVPTFYLITTLPMNFDNTLGYILYEDSYTDTDINQTSNLDPVASALTGAELGITWSGPLRAKYVTSIGNRLVLGNVRDYPELQLQIVGPANLSNSDFTGDTLLFRKDSADLGTLTDMINRVRYEWVNGPSDTASNFIIGTDTFSFDLGGTPPALSAGDWIYLSYATVGITGRDLTYSGWYQVASFSGATVTVNLIGAASAVSYPDSYSVATVPSDVPVMLGIDGNLGQVNGDSFDLFDSMRRMALAINATMRQVDISVTPDFMPWISARGGNDLTTAGQLVVRSELYLDTVPSVTPVFSGYNLFINSLRTTSGTQVSSVTKVFPSRILFSYKNYAEIFDSPTAILDADSQSAIDVNSADGQSITGILPFFGQTAFTAAQQAQVLVVFKTNSIYLVDIDQKVAGNNPIQRIETEGLGCTAPYSIAVTKNGIMFANESGIYCLRRDQSIQYTGKYMERNWTESVNRDQLSIVQGHHYGIGRSYKLSVPILDTETTTGYIENSQVYVYNHTQEDEGKSLGAWDRYDNHPATGWANLGADAFFGSTNGLVHRLRSTGLQSDYRDLDQPILFRIDTRPNDYTNPGIRKVLDSVTVHYRSGANNSGSTLLYSVDLAKEYTPTQPFDLQEPSDDTGLDDIVGSSIITLRHDIGRRRGVFFSIRIENEKIDESLEIAGLDYRVGALDNKGIRAAAQTKK